MLDVLLNTTEQDNSDIQSVKAFCDNFIEGDDMESKFFKAVGDSHREGFKEGMRAAIFLFAELGIHTVLKS